MILTGSRRSKLELPETIWNMKKLRHVDVGRCYLSSLGVENREEASLQMVNMESFSSPAIFSTKDFEDLLQRSPSLRKLSFNYDHFAEESDKIPRSTKLDSLSSKLEFLPKSLHFPELDSLSKLESLKVSCARKLYLTTPLNFPSTLKKLSLSRCNLPWKYLLTISKMPCLEVLKLLRKAFVGLEWDMEDTEFPKLKFLKLNGLPLAKWIAFSESFPSLEVLIVNKCYALNGIPPCFGEILTLKKIEVHASRNAAISAVEIQETQKDFGNEELEVIVSKNLFLE